MARLKYKKVHPRSQFEQIGWIVKGLTQPSGAGTHAQIQAQGQTPSKRVLDVRSIYYDRGTSFAPVVDTVMQTYAPIWSSEWSSFRTSDRAKLDPSKILPEPMSWLKASLNLTDATTYQPYQKQSAPSIYTKVYARDQWSQDLPNTVSLLNPTIASWAPIWSGQAASFRTTAGPKLQPQFIMTEQVSAYISQFLNPQVGATVAQYHPAVSSEAQSYRTPAGASLDVRMLQLAYRHFGIPFDPAVFEGIYTQRRAGDQTLAPNRKTIPTVLNPDIGFAQRNLINPAIPTWIPIFNQLLQSYRTNEGPRAEVRLYEAFGNDIWYQAAIQDLATQQQMPAMTGLAGSYRTNDRNKFEVRGMHFDRYGWLDSALHLTDAPRARHLDHRLLTMGVGR